MRWLVPVGGHRWPAVASGLLAAVVGAVLMLGDWQSAAALTVLVVAGVVLLALTLTPAAWGAAAVAAIVLLVRPTGAPVIAGLVVFLGAAPALAGRRPRITTGTSRQAQQAAQAYPPTARVLGISAVAAAGVLILAAGLALQATQPHPDHFYAQPGHLPGGHGVLVRSEPFNRGLPPGSRAWRILYTTTRGDGTAAVASAVVVAATQAPPGPRPVVVWAHGASGIAPDCAPSLGSDPVGTGSVPDVAGALAAGWVVVAPDYPGLGTAGPHPFLIGQGEARSLLDAVLAARGLTTLTLAAQTLIWGHSQGGNAALWSGIIAPSYAPAVGLAGVAALAPGTGLPALAVQWGDQIYAAYLIEAYSEAYPDVRFDAYVRAAVRVPVRELAGRCPSDRLVSGLSSLLGGRSIWSAGPDTGAFGERLRQNIPDQPIGVPVLIAQGDSDTTVPVAVQNDYVRRECTTGTRLDYRTYPGRDHVGIFTGDSPLLPDLMQWSRERLAGAPARSTCSG